MRKHFFLPVVVLLLSSCELIPDFMKSKKEVASPVIEGTWNLLIYRGESPDGRFHYPFDKNTPGIAFFDRKENFSFQFYDPDRPLLSKVDPFYSADPEIRIAYLSSRAFFGKYELTDSALLIHIIGSNLPNDSGTEKAYAYRLKGDSLLLISPPIRLNGQELREQSIWVRERNEPVSRNKIRSILSRFERS